MKKIIIALFVVVGLAAFLNAQEAVTEAAAEGVRIFPDTGRELIVPKYAAEMDIKVYLIADFENANEWLSVTPNDQGHSKVKRNTGKAPKVTEGQYALGLKEWSYKRGFNWTEISPPGPLKIPGNCKGLAIWVQGRNFRHHLEAWIRNYEGTEYSIDLGSLNFKGWKQIGALVPLHIKQYSKYIPQYRPIHFIKFVLRHDPDERTGLFYLYLDNFEAACDMFEETWEGSDFLDEFGVERFDKEQYTEQIKGAGVQP